LENKCPKILISYNTELFKIKDYCLEDVVGLPEDEYPIWLVFGLDAAKRKRKRKRE